jgi:hypothetical protein
MYGPKGLDARRTESGHVALIVTDLCAKGIDQLRECAPAEAPGVVITKYPSLASDHGETIFVVPLGAHFSAVDDPRSVPSLTSTGTVTTLQIRYWRDHLRPFLPPLSSKRVEALLVAKSKFRLGSRIRGFLTLNFLGKLLGARDGPYSTNTIVLIDPLTQERIPNGNWREAIGAEHVRSATILTLPAELSQELKLMAFIEHSQHEPFNTLSNNCSDFVRKGLLTVFAGKGMRFRPKGLDLADVWITSPLFVATNFFDYANQKKLPLRVSFMPVFAGTARPSPSVKSIVRGALVPEPTQGKLAFALKIYINTLNPLIGISAFAVDKSSKFVDLDNLVHEREGISLSSGTNSVGGKFSGVEAQLRRERIRRFGTSSCWRLKERQFAILAERATEIGALTKAEHSQLLSRDRPYLLPRFYEKLAGAQERNGSLTSGIGASLIPIRSANSNTGFPTIVLPPGSDKFDKMVPSRPEIRAMAESPDAKAHALALRFMTAVINYDLASEPKDRRVSTAFDTDWRLFLDVAERDGVRLAPFGVTEPVEQCSSKEFQKPTSLDDAVQTARKPGNRILSWFRQVIVSPTR